jgi:UDP-3-O-[3-hydroxymyristoyl] glucosamine N-acyltransferase
MQLTVEQLAKHIGAELVGGPNDRDIQITGVSAVKAARENDVTFVKDQKHEETIGQSSAGAVIVGSRIKDLAKLQLVVKNVDAALISVLSLFAPILKGSPEGIDPTAKIGQNVQIGRGVSIGAYVTIDENVEIGENSSISSGCRIGENSRIGKNCHLDRNVVVYHNCTLGNNVIVQANSTIGSVGFGYVFIDGAHRLVPHNGGVVVEDFVEIGANCCIDRAKFGNTNTVIGAGTKVDNLVQIAHNVVIGKCCLISGQVGVAGSCRIGDGVVLGGQVGLADNIEIGAGTMIGAQAGVMSSVGPKQKLAWTPAVDAKEAAWLVAHILRLPKLASQVKRLTKRVEKLEAAENHKG